MSELARTARTTGSRKSDRMSYDVQELHAILDEGLLCHVTYVVDGQPRVIPTLHARIGDHLYLHSSTGSTLGLRARDGVDLAVAVTLFDGLIYARSGFNHSANYRSVVVHGRATLVADLTERETILTAFVDRFSPGRSALLRRANADEIAKTAVLRLPLTEASVKARTDGVEDDPEDLTAPVWAGVLPLYVGHRPHEADNEAAASYPVPVLPPGLA